VPEVERQEDRDRDVRRQEARDGPDVREEDLEAVGQCQNAEDTEHSPRRVGLERRPVWQGVEETVVGERFPEAEVGD